jgi:tetratricopeptide repeat protein 21B
LKYNKSQTKAEELMGMVKEQEQIYVEAAQHYEKAWKLSNNSSASIGYFKMSNFT